MPKGFNKTTKEEKLVWLRTKKYNWSNFPEANNNKKVTKRQLDMLLSIARSMKEAGLYSNTSQDIDLVPGIITLINDVRKEKLGGIKAFTKRSTDIIL